MNLKLTTFSWGCEKGFELETGDPEAGKAPSPLLKVMNGYRGETTFELTKAEIEPVLKLVTRSRIKPFATGPMGVDGVTWNLTISEGSSQSSYEWWTEAGNGWGALDRIVKALLDLAERKMGTPITLFE